MSASLTVLFIGIRLGFREILGPRGHHIIKPNGYRPTKFLKNGAITISLVYVVWY